jgi:phospholipid/cholesterol/gamma-HCH transport system substrate-binding protein
MKTTGTAIKFGAFSVVLLLFTAIIIVVFGQFRFDRTATYSAEFSNASGLRSGQFVRASGVEVGKVTKVALVDGSQRARVDFDVERSLPLFQSTTAQIRYQDLIGNRYLELQRGQGEAADRVLPLFRALDPDKVNNIASAIITVFQGQGGTINDILDQTAQLTSRIAERDQAIGEVIQNLNIVLDTTVRHRKEFDQTVDNFEALITGLKDHADPLAAATAHISNAAGTVADLLADNRAVLHNTINYLDGVQQPIIDQKDQLDSQLRRTPEALTLLGRASGSYGSFFNFYICDIALKINGLQPGGPVRTVKIWSQPTGRCTPQ